MHAHCPRADDDTHAMTQWVQSNATGNNVVIVFVVIIVAFALLPSSLHFIIACCCCIIVFIGIHYWDTMWTLLLWHCYCVAKAGVHVVNAMLHLFN